MRTSTVTNKKPSRMTQTGVFVFFMGLLMLILIWDMKKMHQISEVIHDDHNSLWERMNDSSVRSWWSPLDLCLLKMNDSRMDIKSYRSKSCNKLPAVVNSNNNNNFGNNNVNVQKLFCNAGSSLGKACPAPLSTRFFFHYRLRDAPYRDARSSYLSETLKYLAKRHMPLLFIGDGISKQNEDALICDLLRTDTVQITTGMNMPGYNRSNLALLPDYIITWKDKEVLGNKNVKPVGSSSSNNLQLEVKYFKLTSVENNDFEHNHRVRKQRRRHRKQQRRHLLSTTNDPSLPNKADDTNVNIKSMAKLPKKAFSSSSNGLNGGGMRKFAGGNAGTANRTQGLGSMPKQQRRGGANTTTTASGSDVRLRRVTNTNSSASAAGTGKARKSSNTTTTSKKPQATNTSQTQQTATPLLKLHNLDDLQSAVTAYLTQRRMPAVAVVANLGVFYNSREKFREELPDFLHWLWQLAKEEEDIVDSSGVNTHVTVSASSLGSKPTQSQRRRKNLIFYRETAAQHWNHTDSGYYDPSAPAATTNTFTSSNRIDPLFTADTAEEVEGNFEESRDISGQREDRDSQAGSCVPIADNTPDLDWRNNDVYHMLSQLQAVETLTTGPDTSSALTKTRMRRRQLTAPGTVVISASETTTTGHATTGVLKDNNNIVNNDKKDSSNPDNKITNSAVSTSHDDNSHNSPYLRSFGGLHVIPFHAITMPLFNMHPTSPTHPDCTHYCYFPQMWQSVWYAMYTATLTHTP